MQEIARYARNCNYMYVNIYIEIDVYTPQMKN